MDSLSSPVIRVGVSTANPRWFVGLRKTGKLRKLQKTHPSRVTPGKSWWPRDAHAARRRSGIRRLRVGFLVESARERPLLSASLFRTVVRSPTAGFVAQNHPSMGAGALVGDGRGAIGTRFSAKGRETVP